MRCLKPLHLGIDNNYLERTGIVKHLWVPCGKCVACLSNKRRDWEFRLSKELRNSISAYFITLTYDDEHLPNDGLVNKKHVQNFLKRLRAYVAPNKIRFFLVSEYGESSGRPHYHMLLFNFPFGYDIIKTMQSTWKFCNKEIWKIGKDIPDKGTIGTVTSASISYCAKYCLGNLDNDNPKYRTFMLCSRKPGIGSDFVNEKTVSHFKNIKSDITHTVGNYPISLPRYYKTKIFTEDELFELRLDKETFQARQNSNWRRKYGKYWYYNFHRYETERQNRIRKRLKSNPYVTRHET